MEVKVDLAYTIAEAYSNISFEDLPKEVVETTKKFIMDTIGVALAGEGAPGIREVYNTLEQFGCRGYSHLLGLPGKFSVLDATFMNAALCHALDFDDTMDDSATHCYATVLPPALVLGEEKHISGKTFITAIALGVDLVCRLSLSTTTPLRWIRTATCGSFGATVSSGKVLGLSREQLLNALGIAYSQTSGNAQCLIDGTLTKKIQPAFASRAGLLSALLSREGITGAQGIFEGKYGFFNLYENGQYNRETCLDGLGKTFMGTKLSIKPYPTCRMTHSSIDVSLKLLQRMPKEFKPSEIEKIEIKVCKMSKEMVGRKFEVRSNPQVDAQFSIPYCVSVVFTKKEAPFLDDIENDTILSHKWDELTNRIEVITDDSIGEQDIHKAHVKVKLGTGKILEESTTTLRGSPNNPLSWEECTDKFVRCASMNTNEYTQDELNQLIQHIMNLERTDDISLVIPKSTKEGRR